MVIYALTNIKKEPFFIKFFLKRVDLSLSRSFSQFYCRDFFVGMLQFWVFKTGTTAIKVQKKLHL